MGGPHRRRRTGAKGVIAWVAAMAFVLAACGGGDDAADEPVDESTTTTTTSTTTTSTTTTTTTMAVLTGDSDSEWCRLARDLNESDPFSDALDFTDPAAVEAAFTEMRDAIDEIRDVAPDEIEGDVETLAEAIEQLYTTLAAADFDFFALMDDLEALELLDDPAYQAASDRVQAYNQDVCGLELDDDGDVASGDISALIEAGGLTEILVQEFVALGFTEEEANCLAENIDVAAFAGGGEDPESAAAMLSVFDDCGISLERLAEIGG